MSNMNILIETHKNFNFILPVFLWQILGEMAGEVASIFEWHSAFFLNGKHFNIWKKGFKILT